MAYVCNPVIARNFYIRICIKTSLVIVTTYYAVKKKLISTDVKKNQITVLNGFKVREINKFKV